MFLGLATILSAPGGHIIHSSQCQPDRKGTRTICLLSLNPPVEKKQYTDEIETTCNSERPIGISEYSWKGHDSSDVESEDEYFCVYLLRRLLYHTG